MANLQKFVREGGLLIAVDDTANFAVQYGFTSGVSITPAQRLKITGAVLRSKRVDETSPIAYGYEREPVDLLLGRPDLRRRATWSGRGAGAAAAARRGARPGAARRTIRISRRAVPPSTRCPTNPRVEPWQAAPMREEQLRNGVNVIPPAQRPRVIFRYGDARDLLVSGLLDAGTEIAQRPMVVDVPVDKGHVVLFSNNPIWRGETQRQLLPGAERDPEPRQPERGAQAGCEVEPGGRSPGPGAWRASRHRWNREPVDPMRTCRTCTLSTRQNSKNP